MRHFDFYSTERDIKDSIENLVTSLISGFVRYAIPPTDVINLALLLVALRQLPKAPEDIFNLSVSVSGGDDQFSEIKYWSFTLSNNQFSVDSGGSVYEKGIGGDSYSGASYLVEIDGGNGSDNYGFDVYTWDRDVREHLDAELTLEISISIE